MPHHEVQKISPACFPRIALTMSHLKLNKTCLSLVLGTVAFQAVADDRNDAAKEHAGGSSVASVVCVAERRGINLAYPVNSDTRYQWARFVARTLPVARRKTGWELTG